jgi:branched-chain amino acid transport system substrate-binding protein
VPWGTYELARTFVDSVQNYLAPKLGKNPKELKIAIVHEDSGYGSEAIQYVQQEAKNAGLNLVYVQAYNAQRMTDFTPMLLRIKDLSPDILVGISYLNDAVKFQQQAKEQNVYVPAMIGMTAGYGQFDFVETLGKAADNILVVDSNPFLNPDALDANARKLNDEFVKRFTAKHGRPPASHTLYAFTGSYSLFNHDLAKVDSLDRDVLLKQAMSLDLPYGSLPLGFGLKFTAENAERPHYNERGLVLLNQWQGSKYVTVYPQKFATGEIKGFPLPQWSER